MKAACWEPSVLGLGIFQLRWERYIMMAIWCPDTLSLHDVERRRAQLKWMSYQRSSQGAYPSHILYYFLNKPLSTEIKISLLLCAWILIFIWTMQWLEIFLVVNILLIEDTVSISACATGDGPNDPGGDNHVVYGTKRWSPSQQLCHQLHGHSAPRQFYKVS